MRKLRHLSMQEKEGKDRKTTKKEKAANRIKDKNIIFIDSDADERLRSEPEPAKTLQ